MPRRLPGVLILIAVLAPPPAAAGDAELLPELRLRLMGARYAPAERDFQWVGWVGGEVGFFRIGSLTAFGSADLETVIGNERRGFDANQANYHLTIGARRDFGGRRLAVVFDHVSRHTADRSKPEAVDWNTLALRFAGTLRRTPPLRFELQAGHTTLASLIGYRFEAVLGLEAELLTRPGYAVYLGGRTRGVTTETSAAFPRDGFVDVWVEAGVEARRQARRARAFVAFEHRNDVRLVVPAARSRALVGLRFGLEPE